MSEDPKAIRRRTITLVCLIVIACSSFLNFVCNWITAANIDAMRAHEDSQAVQRYLRKDAR